MIEQMSALRIAHIVEATTGGVARHVLDLVTRLDPEACTPVLYLSLERPESWREAFEAVQARGVLLREVPMRTVPNAAAVTALATWAREDGIDLFHLHSAKAGYLGRQAAQRAGIPVIYTPHAFPFQRTTDLLSPLYRYLERKLALETARIICVSHGEYEEALAAGLPAERLVVISNGLDIDAWPAPSREERRNARERYGIADDQVVAGMLARMAPQKGIDLLIQAADDMLSDYPRARIDIWGDGPERHALQKLARRMQLHRRVTFHSPPDTPREAYAAMDVYCAPSRWEAGPYGVLEAMACRLPVVASDVAGNRDAVVNGVTGLLFAADLPGPLSGALRVVLSDEDIRLNYGEAGCRRVRETFTLDTMLAETAALYHAVCTRETVAAVKTA